MIYDLVYDLGQANAAWLHAVQGVLLCLALAMLVYRFPSYFSTRIPLRAARRRAALVGAIMTVLGAMLIHMQPPSGLLQSYMKNQYSSIEGIVETLHSTRAAPPENEHFRVQGVTFALPDFIAAAPLYDGNNRRDWVSAGQLVRIDYLRASGRVHDIVRLEVARTGS